MGGMNPNFLPKNSVRPAGNLVARPARRRSQKKRKPGQPNWPPKKMAAQPARQTADPKSAERSIQLSVKVRINIKFRQENDFSAKNIHKLKTQTTSFAQIMKFHRICSVQTCHVISRDPDPRLGSSLRVRVFQRTEPKNVTE
jgi:hypothetical protein